MAFGLGIRNANTSETLFISRTFFNDFTATFSPAETIITFQGIVCTLAERSVLNLTVLFFTLAVLFIPFLFFYKKGKIDLLSTNPKIIIIIFVGVILGIVFSQVIAESIFSFCG